MRRIIRLLGVLAILLGVAGSASAGYWEVVYDLAGSTTTTIVTAAASTDVDQVTGSFTIQYDTPGTASAPITGARLVAGGTHMDLYNDVGVFLLTGSFNTPFTPPFGGVVGAISGVNLSGLSGIPNAATGYIQCFNGASTCTAAGYPVSTPIPQTATSPPPLNLGKLVFNNPVGAASATHFTSTGATQVVPPGPGQNFTVSLITVYVGQEISRTFSSVSTVPSVSEAGRVGLGLCLVLGGASVLVRRRGRRAGHAG
jgi:hypothetical protein